MDTAPAEHEVGGHLVKCPTCGGARFWSRRSVLNTRGATFFGFDWANRGIVNLVCADCTRIVSFHDEARVRRL